jgi:hypothetical protein
VVAAKGASNAGPIAGDESAVNFMTPSSSRNQRSKALIAAVLVVAALSVIWWRLQRPPTLEEVATHTIQAVEAGDGARAMRFVRKQEAEALGLTGPKLTQVLRELNRPLERAEKGSGAIEQTAEASSILAIKRTPLSDGKELDISITAVTTDEGAKVLSLVYMLFHYGLSESLPNDPAARQGIGRVGAAAREVDRLSKVFEDAGIEGVYIDDPNGPVMMSWSELREHFEKKLAIAEERKARGQATTPAALRSSVPSR